MVYFGIFLLIVGITLFFIQRNQNQKVFSIKSARTATAAELLEIAGAVATEMGGGSWRDYVKLWGEVVADQPLHSEHKHEPCVYYAAKVIREYETTETSRAEKGALKTERKRRSETISHNRRSIPFWLRDRTGNIKVDLEGADIETVSVLNEFHPEQSGDTLGYRYQESILPIGRNVLIVGAVSDQTGEVFIRKPVQSSHKYIISLKDEETLATKTSRNAKINFYIMLICLLSGSIAIVLSLFTNNS